MRTGTHVEQHFTGSDAVRDLVLGMSDGLTVPFALAAGLSGAVDTTRIIVVAGLAEIAAGSIAMGLGGYLAARSDIQHYRTEKLREQAEVQAKPEAEIQEVVEVFTSYGLRPEEAHPVALALSQRPDAWVDFMMRFELGLEQPDPRRAVRSALTIGGAYVLGGIIPLSPYLLLTKSASAFPVSVATTLLALGLFGYIKGRVAGASAGRSALETMLIGGLAAAAAFLIARAIT
jgi:VIT1/CCC1 family predicted Fe2+/Mn2+ transporter